ncbi:MAG: enoyl-[acyl-carrier-protein] reductase FabI [Betaproteobacteria bacterium]|nr:enoyl-ACP reductase FabI [Pseudomonadota bacterium]NBQ78732.1 enoyl-[acyl-carrier-protein] reductase FabI [Betaproteobacteria bacterium]NBY54616.1 enoyl-[acyl-carrier-protein] reductase FabI [Betaproteobacteria bacterium]NDF49072.1 enoyl-[acyl-carrier-protein] reductase FabI [Betaproteobacteria bacterium]NDG81222.1 enoyl-[acyl-carrier-protein] reductase FabI [Betaproteobacteria bacterium]
MSESDVIAPSQRDPLPKIWDENSKIGEMLRGRRGLIVGVANEHSIAFGCAAKLRGFGAEVALTYLNAKAKPYVEPLAEQVGASMLLPLDVSQESAVASMFEQIKAQWGYLDFVIHSIAFAPKDDLHGRIVDCSRDGFLQAMQISCHSFIELARYAEPLMRPGGALVTMSYYGADKVVQNYNMMGPVKAALESTVRYMAHELGQSKIRVYAVSPGPLKTRAASGIDHFDELVRMAVERTPEHRLVDIAEVGRVVAFLVGGAASGMTGDVIYVDAGLHHMA